MKGENMKFNLGSGLVLAMAVALVSSTALADTVRIAEHKQARIEALQKIVPSLEQKTGAQIEIVEYPGPDREYVAKLLTELRAGAGPDIMTLPQAGNLADFSAAGYIVPMTEEFTSWEGYDEIYDIVKKLLRSDDGEFYGVPASVSVQQLYFRKDILEEAGVSVEQPKTWADLLDRMIEAKEKTGKKSLLLPMGVTWGSGAFDEGFLYFLTGSSDPVLIGEDGKFNLSSSGILDVLTFYEALVKNGLTPIDPLLGPEPWAVPKYEMFPAGDLLATTCGEWCYIYDWGPESRNPIPNVTEAVGTWAVPGKDGGQYVMVRDGAPWTVSANAVNIELSKAVALELGSVESTVGYTEKQGSIPPRADAIDSPEFQRFPALIPILKEIDNGSYYKSAEGFSVVAEGVARATEALLLGSADAAGAQEILVDYVSNALGSDKVK